MTDLSSTGIRWRRNIEEAEKEIEGTGKLLLLFFHHPDCGGCRKNMEITFRDPKVRELIERDFVPLAYEVTEAQDMTHRYGVEWTPTFVIADENGRELERWVGYLPPDEFISQIYLSEGLCAFHRDRFKEAESAFEWIIGHQPDSYVAPEARYYMGVSLFKETGDPVHLAETWKVLKTRYPGNLWTKKASAWS